MAIYRPLTGWINATWPMSRSPIHGDHGIAQAPKVKMRIAAAKASSQKTAKFTIEIMGTCLVRM